MTIYRFYNTLELNTPRRINRVDISSQEDKIKRFEYKVIIVSSFFKETILRYNNEMFVVFCGESFGCVTCVWYIGLIIQNILPFLLLAELRTRFVDKCMCLVYPFSVSAFSA